MHTGKKILLSQPLNFGGGLPDDAYEEILDKCDDSERDVSKEKTANHYTYAKLEENDVGLKKL
ncbi:Chromate resistance protein ChrB [Pseudogemmobacter sp. W21_MBD1_M6]|uniref:Chromate resistance protein ChrB n=1 Tax=Pseudogemmobacter sp. W21_MBD1_M6 TaxID=3240271 RepID=UPI003F978942